ncbi:cryptochrome/photolyase family protein [Paracoccus spongiarum]|uniref:Deoxyribodipyrimidine photo-lyase n=1 Tax=Paracoccus spongiarum TaxID=3064387 RepID=A0ABT9JD63_9RHOB|nr:deoxyribodipyrimidine photo-lyase [Paracoccus sp. 2205BS29-5]MDP5307763.1 deoxyribodipyrimidine photo-lyase [Paracoccus sp. 2205BS29-5]
MAVICWFRRVLRLDDHPALCAAAAEGEVIPLVILDPEEARDHPASAQRQALSLPRLQAALHRHHSRLIVRRGAPAGVLEQIARQTGATQIHATEGFPFASDHGLAAAAQRGGARLVLHPLADLAGRGALTTQQGGIYKVFTPYWRALRASQIADPLPVPRLSSPADWPDSEDADGKDPDWPEARAAMRRGWPVVAGHVEPGEDRALQRLHDFLDGPVADYATHRDQPWRDAGTSGLSDALAVGEISPRRIWQVAGDARRDGRPGVEDFLRELGWREFARELFHDAPEMGRTCWREEWQDFPWRRDNAAAEDWRRAATGVPMVDAGLRELFVTGRMHNRVRMIAASYLTKHLLTDWRVGLDWFARTLTDWDPASNAMNWQWVAGCGPDAAPYFRVFNPDTQAEKFDAAGRYRDHWLKASAAGAQEFARAAPLSWKIDLARPPAPAISLAQGRARALTAYEEFKP